MLNLFFKRLANFIIIAILVIYPSKMFALGDLVSSADNFWSIVIVSYRYDSLEDYRNSFRRMNSEERSEAIARGELPLVGIIKTSNSYEPRNPQSVTCIDFQAVDLTDPSDSRITDLPYGEVNLYLEISGSWLGIGEPKQAEFWIAAVLPENSEPLFNSNGVGLNYKILSRPLIQDWGYSNGLTSLPANKLVLKSVLDCGSFDIYNVAFKR